MCIEEIHIGLSSSKPDFILVVNSMWKMAKGVNMSVPASAGRGSYPRSGWLGNGGVTPGLGGLAMAAVQN